MECPGPRARLDGQADARYVAICYAIARLPALAPLPAVRGQRSVISRSRSHRRKDSVAWYCGGIRSHYGHRAITGRRGAQLCGCPSLAASIECSCFLCEIFVADILAK